MDPKDLKDKDGDQGLVQIREDKDHKDSVNPDGMRDHQAKANNKDLVNPDGTRDLQAKANHKVKAGLQVQVKAKVKDGDQDLIKEYLKDKATDGTQGRLKAKDMDKGHKEVIAEVQHKITEAVVKISEAEVKISEDQLKGDPITVVNKDMDKDHKEDKGMCEVGKGERVNLFGFKFGDLLFAYLLCRFGGSQFQPSDSPSFGGSSGTTLSPVACRFAHSLSILHPCL